MNMKAEDRWYQAEGAEALLKAVEVPGCKPLVAVPTGGGKTHILGRFFRDYLKKHPHDQLTLLSHTQEILEQDYETLKLYLPDIDIGIYSASLGLKEIGQVTVAGIQTAVRNSKKFQWTNLWMVDEVHAVNHNRTGSYRKLLDDHPAKIAGMSATVFRTGHGYLHHGKNALFNKLVYDLTSLEKFNRLVEEGYLCPLVAVAPKTQLDSKGIKKTGDDYNSKALSEAHNRKEITEAAIEDALHYGKKYKKWLTFAIDIEHAESICKILNERGIKSEVLHSRMTDDRKDVVKRFKQGDTRALVSVGMVTTGFDAPNVDLILMLRPTLSAVLHVQMLGRGLRIFPDKAHCLVLDYAGNLMRLGPINQIKIPNKKEKGSGEAPCKTCPDCSTICAIKAKECPSCGHTFEFKTKLVTTAGTTEAMAAIGSSEQKWLKVDMVIYRKHMKAGKPPSIKTTYKCGVQVVDDYICPLHPGFAGQQGRHKLKVRGWVGPYDIEKILQESDKLKVPTNIFVDFSGKYKSIKNATF